MKAVGNDGFFYLNRIKKIHTFERKIKHLAACR